VKTLLSKIKAALSRALRALLRLEDPAVRERVLDSVEAFNDLLEYAIRAAEIVARLTPTPADDVLVAALARINRTADAVLSIEDKVERDGALLALAAEVTRLLVGETIARFGPVTIGGVRVAAEDLLSNSLVRSAAQFAYGVVFKRIKG
jgi:hypothetical protein